MTSDFLNTEASPMQQPTATGCQRLAPRLKAAIHKNITNFLSNKPLLFSLLDGFGSPLNLVFPGHILESIASFDKVYKDRNLNGCIYFTSKPNKSAALKKQASRTTVGLDVSSEGELKNGLACGFDAKRIEATGPKNPDYLSLCIQQDVLINVDSFSELQIILQLATSTKVAKKIRILIRLDGFKSQNLKFTKQDSTFGIQVNRAGDLLQFLVDHQHIFDFQGFSFHFNANDLLRRPLAIEKCLELTFACQTMGLSPKGLDIGGGYRISYADSQSEWNAWVEELKLSVLGHSPAITWNGSGLGFSTTQGVLKGAPTFMEHYHKVSGPSDLAQIIDTPLAAYNNQSLAQILSDTMLELYIEPGRALLDQCGITLARVHLIKPSIEDQTLVLLEMNRTNINSTQLQLLTDPIVVHRHQSQIPAKNGVLYAGNLCLTHDMIQYQKSFPEFLPQPGDAVAFINTAAYQMDFAETNVLGQRIAEKIAVCTHDHQFHWFKDEIYNPLFFECYK